MSDTEVGDFRFIHIIKNEEDLQGAGRVWVWRAGRGQCSGLHQGTGTGTRLKGSRINTAGRTSIYGRAPENTRQTQERLKGKSQSLTGHTDGRKGQGQRGQ